MKTKNASLDEVPGWRERLDSNYRPGLGLGDGDGEGLGDGEGEGEPQGPLPGPVQKMTPEMSLQSRLVPPPVTVA